MLSSLLKSNQQTLALLDEVPPEVIAAQHETGVYSGAVFFDNHPSKYKAVVWLLSQGVGKLRIADTLQCSVHTVMAVAEREGETIAIHKKKIAAAARRGCGLMVESIIEDLEDPERRKKIAPRDKAVVAGILKDVAAHMDGEAQIRVEAVISAASSADDFERQLKALQSAEVVEIAPAMDSAAEIRPQKGGDLAAGEAAAEFDCQAKENPCK